MKVLEQTAWSSDTASCCVSAHRALYGLAMLQDVSDRDALDLALIPLWERTLDTFMASPGVVSKLCELIPNMPAAFALIGKIFAAMHAAPFHEALQSAGLQFAVRVSTNRPSWGSAWLPTLFTHGALEFARSAMVRLPWSSEVHASALSVMGASIAEVRVTHAPAAVSPFLQSLGIADEISGMLFQPHFLPYVHRRGARMLCEIQEFSDTFQQTRAKLLDHMRARLSPDASASDVWGALRVFRWARIHIAMTVVENTELVSAARVAIRRHLSIEAIQVAGSPSVLFGAPSADAHEAEEDFNMALAAATAHPHSATLWEHCCAIAASMGVEKWVQIPLPPSLTMANFNSYRHCPQLQKLFWDFVVAHADDEVVLWNALCAVRGLTAPLVERVVELLSRFPNLRGAYRRWFGLVEDERLGSILAGR